MADNPEADNQHSSGHADVGGKAGGAENVWRLLGPITWLLSQSPQHRHMFISDIAWLVLPALQLKQCKLYVHKGVPIAYASWARVSDDVHARMQAGMSRLAPGEWRCGSHTWLMDLVSPFGGAKHVLRDVRSGALSGEDVSMLAVDPAGDGVRYRTWKADDSAAGDTDNLTDQESDPQHEH